MFKTKDQFKQIFLERLESKFGRNVQDSHITERYEIIGHMIRDYAGANLKNLRTTDNQKHPRQLIYFSMEFLIGKLMLSNLQNLGIYDIVDAGLKDLNLSLQELIDMEMDAGLGNGGLGRLAACFLDSIASLGYAGHGNTIRYDYGFFKQKIVNGKQNEVPDIWLKNGNIWEVKNLKHAVDVKFYGHAETYLKPEGGYAIRTVNALNVRAVPYDMAVVGYRNNVTNNLRLWSAEPTEENIPSNQNFKEYLQTVKEITHGLYPDDSTEQGKILRLRQHYFLVSAGLQSVIASHYRRFKRVDNVADYFVFQLNDTHPILAIPEFMRIMMDDYGQPWDAAWKQLTHCMAYTNHTVMAEALEKWPVHYMQPLLPRIFMIIEEIHRRSQLEFSQKHLSEDARRNMAIIKDGMVYMANLAIYSTFSTNGVAALHTDILKADTFKDYFQLYPERFNNKTNGITHRRWMMYSNPSLASAITKRIGESWKTQPQHLEKLLAYQDDVSLQTELANIKLENKKKLAVFLKSHQQVDLNVETIFDVQIKRLHAYKRQLMNIFHIMYLYQKMKQDRGYRIPPRTFLFGAKAAPSYFYAKKIIELIHAVAKVVNQDPEINPYLRVVFVENYGVSISEKMIPASDISEQISTAGKEASGTGNMKFMMNGAITLGTLDGANVEIADLVGSENCVIFGMKVDQVNALYQNRTYRAWDMYTQFPHLKAIIDSLIDGTWSEGNLETFRPIFDEIMHRNDEYFVLKDFDAYAAAQEKIANLYLQSKTWQKMAIVNIAKSGFFSTDRTIQQYVDDIWRLKKII
ncbi:MAG: glycogen/starch/alpha-glucan phosphorylase [Bacilli bacterium]